MIGLVGLAAMVPTARASLEGAGHAVTLAVGSAVVPLTGVAAWLVWRRIDVALERKRAALRRWGWLMLSAALWPALLTVTGEALTTVPALLACLLAAVVTFVSFRRLRPVAALLLLPFIAWLLGDAASVIIRFWTGSI